MRTSVVVVVLGIAALFSTSAEAFCGFYVSGADAKLFNNATMVVLMRDGTRTVLSIQNNYQGPPEEFAMVVPVPVVLKKENVKTLPPEVFSRIDQLAAPRLVEYWEQDPCAPGPYGVPTGKRKVIVESSEALPDWAVKIDARFTVAEYEILILSARDSAGLDKWLRSKKYRIPEGAEAVLRPYVQAGSKFFVAKVDPKKVRFLNGQAMLSPLRFHYDSKDFNLPVRLGLLNSSGTQDLIVHILAPGLRYEVANYPNYTIPTNLDLKDPAKNKFGAFYVALFDTLLKKHPGAVVTEYAWDAGTCDPCPSPPLSPEEIATLGGDVLQPAANETGAPIAKAPPTKAKRPPSTPPKYVPIPPLAMPATYVLTRLHARYGKDTLGEDLVFRAAPPIQGGREVRDVYGHLERSALPASINNFQGRYAIRHPWTGPIGCAQPQRGVWGGPPGTVGRPIGAEPALGLAFAPRGAIDLGNMLTEDLDDLGVQATRVAEQATATPAAPATPTSAPSTGTAPARPPSEPPLRSGCAGCRLSAKDRNTSEIGLGLLFGLSLLVRRRRSRPSSRSWQ
jgi:hypothetical protein